MNQGIGDLAMCLMNITPDGFSGNTESCGCLLLFKFLQIDEVKYRHLFRQQRDNLLIFIRTALWSKTLPWWSSFERPVQAWAAPPPAALTFVTACCQDPSPPVQDSLPVFEWLVLLEMQA